MAPSLSYAQDKIETATTGAASKLEPPAKAEGLWLNIDYEQSVARWKARALEESISQFLFDSVQLQLKTQLTKKNLLKGEKCLELEFTCLARALQRNLVNVWINGLIRKDGQNILLQAIDTRARQIVATEELDFTKHMSLNELRHRVYRLIKPFVMRGGLLDEYHRNLETEEVIPEVVTPNQTSNSDHFLVLTAIVGTLIFLFWLPVIVLWDRKEKIPLKWLMVTLTVFLPVSLFGCYFWPERNFLLFDSSIGYVVKVIQYVFGGAAWAAVIVSTARFIAPPLRGLDRASHFTIFAILRAWIYVGLYKAIVLFMCLSPTLIAIILLANYFQISDSLVWILLIPLGLLLTILWFFIWLTNLSYFVDRRLAKGAFEIQNPWDREIRKYFLGYIKRMDIDLAEDTIEELRFCTGTVSMIASYGGGLTHPRIFLPKALLKYALGEFDINEDTEDGTKNFPDLSSALKFPQKRQVVNQKKKLQNYQNRFLNLFRRVYDPAVPIQKATAPFNVHSASVLGFVIPRATNETEALAADSRDDFHALAELLTAHYSQFSREQEDEEFDDTDPTDKDFLFGALLREYGMIEQRLHILNNFSLGLHFIVEKAPEFIQRIFYFFKVSYSLSFSKYPDRLGDSIAALNSARNHLVQHIFFVATSKLDHVTSRADPSTLYAVSKKLFREFEFMKPASRAQQPFQAALLSRFVWLSEFFYGSMVKPSDRRLRQLIIVMFIAVFFSIGLAMIQESVNYNSVYKERMAKATQQPAQESPSEQRR